MTTRYVKDGTVPASLVDYIVNRARGGAAMIVIEPLNMHSGQRGLSRPDVFNGLGLDSIRRVTAALRAEGSCLLGQIQDSGRGRHEQGRSDSAIGPSSLPDDISWTVPHALTIAEIRRLIDEFAYSSKCLRDAGVAGVEISAGHGHLFHQFMSSWSNRREDEFGGDIVGRTRVVRELIEAIRSECGGDFIIGLKLPGDDGVPGSIDLQEAERIAAAVAATGEVDYWTFVWGTHANTLYKHLPDAYGERAPYLAGIRRLREVSSDIPTAALGYITDPNEAERALTDGTADLVMLGRPLLADPAWAKKAQQRREAEIRYCVSCNTCWRTIIEGDRLECDNNPRVGQREEQDWWPSPAKRRRRLVIVGAGIAGMEAAWVAAARGHEVTVLGSGKEVGGKTRLHAGLPGGENLSSIYDYQLLAAKRSKADIELGVFANADTVVSLQPDKVVLATGSTMAWPAFLPEEYRKTGFFPDLREVTAKMLGRIERQSGRIVIYDKDHTEMTYAAAEFLRAFFDEVILVTPRERVASDVALVNRQRIYQRLHDCRIRLVTCGEPSSESEFEEARVTITNVFNGEQTIISDVAAVTYSTPRSPNDSLMNPLREAGIDVTAIGDCYAPRSVLAATREGHEIANSLT